MKREQCGEDMVDIMSYLQKYVPRKSTSGDLYPIFFGGDQLTKERAVGAQDAKLQSKDSQRKLKGLLPVIEDWHAWMTFHQVYPCNRQAEHIQYLHTCMSHDLVIFARDSTIFLSKYLTACTCMHAGDLE